MGLTGVTLPNSVTRIEKNAFRGNKLTGVIIPNSVTYIGRDAFPGNELRSVTLPDHSIEIGYDAFSGNQLSSVTIPTIRSSGESGVVGGGAFSNNYITSIKFADGITSIGGFEGNQLTSLTIPDSVTSIGSFDGNQLTGITIPKSVTYIGYKAFRNNLLTSITIQNGVTTIENSAFSGNQLTVITIPQSVKTIDIGAFTDNPLASVMMPSGVTFRQNGPVSSPKDKSKSDEGLIQLYNKNGKQAGIYTKSRISWKYKIADEKTRKIHEDAEKQAKQKADQAVQNNKAAYHIGDTGPSGGIVFYDKGTLSDGWRYLEAAPNDCADSEWGAYKKSIPGNYNDSVGSGKQNTQIIVDYLKKIGEPGKAAQLCASLSIGGKQDWYLPSTGELDLLYKNLKLRGLSDFLNGYGTMLHRSP
jgi:hypothetical protein